jgi:GT2 family glycosyltransferase
MQPRIYALIPVFNGIQHTQTTVSALKPLMPPGGKIVVIDDGSTDGTEEILNREHPEVTVLRGDGNLWWSGAINMGARFALEEGADYVLFLNNDVILSDNFLEELLKGAQEFPEALISSKILSSDEPWKVWSSGGRVNWWSGKFWMLGCGQADDHRYNEPLEADWLPGMSVLVPVGVFRQNVWVDDKAFPQYAGDTDFSLRARKAGFNLIVWSSSVIYNKVRNSGVVSKLLLGVEPFSFRLLWECLTSIKSSVSFCTFGKLVMRHAPLITRIPTLLRYYGFFFLKVAQVSLGLPGPRKWLNRKRFAEYVKSQERNDQQLALGEKTDP